MTSNRAGEANPSVRPDAEEPYTFVHRWPWRREEFVSMGVAAGLVLLLGYWVSTARPFYATPILIVTALLAIGSVYLLYRTKMRRVTISQVTITITGTLVSSSSEGLLGKSLADVAQAKAVATRRFGSDETFVISDGTKSVRIPLRATSDERVLDALTTALDKATNTDADAHALYARVSKV